MNFSSSSNQPVTIKGLLHYLEYYQFYPRKQLSQNFLIDQNISAMIIKALCLDKEDVVFEIGTGFGSLTLALAPLVRHIFSIEKDCRLRPILHDLISPYQKSITLIYQDMLTFNLADFLKKQQQKGDKIEKIVGNLPYAISLPLLRKLMEMHKLIAMAVVMVQKEVAERMMAQPGNKNYGVISVMSQVYSKIEKIHLVKPDAFYPKPEVDSMIIRIRFFQEPGVRVEDEILFFDIVRAIFQHRRKKVDNALKLYFGDRLDKDKLIKLLPKIGLNNKQRGETFDLTQFAQLTEEIKKIIK